jgi:two-component system chemotaxis response regulator CheB
VVNVLIVEDSAVFREYLRGLLSADPAVRVVGSVTNGVEALDFLRKNKPDVITMDVHMPKMDGLEATRRIMESSPVPIVIISASVTRDDVATSFQALQAGAVAVIGKPRGIGHPDHPAMTQELLQTVKSMSEVRVVRRWRAASARNGNAPAAIDVPAPATTLRLVAIGASTGGPPVLCTILSQLPADFEPPIVIVQHISPGFVGGLAEWLDRTALLTVRVAVNGEKLLPRHVYLAPDGLQAGVDAGGRMALSDAAAENGLRPAVSYLFRSVAAVYGNSAAGVLLTGMGRDGAEDLNVLRQTGAVTIAQDQPSSVVHGMPGEAIRLGAATHVLPPDGIAALLRKIAGHGATGAGSAVKRNPVKS